jgi:hypothetical protein
MQAAIRERLLAHAAEDRARAARGDNIMRLDLSWLRPVLSYARERQVGCILYGNESDATFYAAQQASTRRRSRPDRAEHEAWTQRWKAEAEAAFAEPGEPALGAA